MTTLSTRQTPITSVVIVARILLALMFVVAGASKFANLPGTAGYITSGGLPFGALLAPVVAAVELFFGLAIIIGWQARWAALGLALFTIVASLLFHKFWAVPADQAFVQQLMFMKNLAVAGGLLMVFSFGAGPGSLDARSASASA